MSENKLNTDSSEYVDYSDTDERIIHRHVSPPIQKLKP